MGHRRFLASNHPYRKKKSWFDRTHEKRGKPPILIGSKVLKVVSDIKNDFGKGEEMCNDEETRKGRATRRGRGRMKAKDLVWKKKPIFFELPYYEGTQLYDSKAGGWRDLGMLYVMQIFGRAGRPQFDKSSEGIIITSHDKLAFYLTITDKSTPP